MVNMDIDLNILKAAIDKWGVDAQKEMIEEECIELALALKKLRRKRGDMGLKMANVIDEIADVKIMIQQAELMFDSNAIAERVAFKIQRLADRIKEGVM